MSKSAQIVVVAEAIGKIEVKLVVVAAEEKNLARKIS